MQAVLFMLTDLASSEKTRFSKAKMFLQELISDDKFLLSLNWYVWNNSSHKILTDYFLFSDHAVGFSND